MANLPELVIFDCDGVLVDSEPIAAKVLAQYISTHGRATTTDECLQLFTGLSLSSVAKIITSKWQIQLPDNFVEQLRALDRAAFANELKALPGVERTINLLKQRGIKVCVASSGSIEKITHSLSITNLLELFDGNIFSATNVANGKPAPDIFLLSADKMGAGAENTIVIEDSPVGITAGKNALMRVYAFSGGGHTKAPNFMARINNAGADMIFSSMDELPKLLGF
ncbi:MAG: HAD family hydrolase [Rhodospirillaceae bacterium]|nr:HAD family hydrolase [Rhodospirillaceae bacterium]